MHVKNDAGKSVSQSPLDQGYCKVGDVDAYPLAFELLRCVNGGAATAKRVKNNVALITRHTEDPLQQGEGFLSGVSKAFFGHHVNRVYVCPNVLQRHAWHFIKIALVLGNVARLVLDDSTFFDKLRHVLFAVAPVPGNSHRYGRCMGVVAREQASLETNKI